jgi:hypothetical protein
MSGKPNHRPVSWSPVTVQSSEISAYDDEHGMQHDEEPAHRLRTSGVARKNGQSRQIRLGQGEDETTVTPLLVSDLRGHTTMTKGHALNGLQDDADYTHLDSSQPRRSMRHTTGGLETQAMLDFGDSDASMTDAKEEDSDYESDPDSGYTTDDEFGIQHDAPKQKLGRRSCRSSGHARDRKQLEDLSELANADISMQGAGDDEPGKPRGRDRSITSD